MSFEVEPRMQEISVLRIGKTLDFRNAQTFRAVCQEQIKKGQRRFVLDFSQTQILDSMGIGSIFSVYRELQAQENAVVLAALSRPVQFVVQLTRIGTVFREFSSVEEACQALQ